MVDFNWFHGTSEKKHDNFGYPPGPGNPRSICFLILFKWWKPTGFIFRDDQKIFEPVPEESEYGSWKRQAKRNKPRTRHLQPEPQWAGGKRLWSGSKMFFFFNVATSYGFWTINHMGTFFVDGWYEWWLIGSEIVDYDGLWSYLVYYGLLEIYCTHGIPWDKNASRASMMASG